MLFPGVKTNLSIQETWVNLTGVSWLFRKGNKQGAKYLPAKQILICPWTLLIWFSISHPTAEVLQKPSPLPSPHLSEWWCLCFVQFCRAPQVWEYKSRLNVFNPWGKEGPCSHRIRLDFCVVLAACKHSGLVWFRIATGRGIWDSGILLPCLHLFRDE